VQVEKKQQEYEEGKGGRRINTCVKIYISTL
jgi:hypothetical protein